METLGDRMPTFTSCSGYNICILFKLCVCCQLDPNQRKYAFQNGRVDEPDVHGHSATSPSFIVGIFVICHIH